MDSRGFRWGAVVAIKAVSFRIAWAYLSLAVLYRVAWCSGASISRRVWWQISDRFSYHSTLVQAMRCCSTKNPRLPHQVGARLPESKTNSKVACSCFVSYVLGFSQTVFFAGWASGVCLCFFSCHCWRTRVRPALQIKGCFFNVYVYCYCLLVCSFGTVCLERSTRV